MRILIDLQSCQSGSRHGGIGRYSLALVQAMARQARNHELWILLNSLIPNTIESVRNDLDGLIPSERILVFSAPDSVAEANWEHQGRTRIAEYLREHFIASLRPDFLLITSLVEGLSEDIVTSVDLIYPGERTAVILYDLIPLFDKKKYLTTRIVEDHYLNKIAYMKKAGLLLAISEYSRQEGISALDLPENRVVNISSASTGLFAYKSLSNSEKNHLSQKFGIRKPFLLYTSSFDQRKNQANLVEAFSLLPQEIRGNYQVVFVGNGWETIYTDLRNHGLYCGLDEGQLIFTGRVDDGVLLNLYNAAYLFVFPSYCEGFGLPILEAMSCGTPVIGSNTTSIPEVIGCEDALFDPLNPQDIARKIQQVLTDENFRNSLSEHGLVQSRKFSWNRSATIALDAMEEAHVRLIRHSNTIKFPKKNKFDTELNISGNYHAVMQLIASILKDEGEDFNLLDDTAHSLAKNLNFIRSTSKKNENYYSLNWFVHCSGSQKNDQSILKYISDSLNSDGHISYWLDEENILSSDISKIKSHFSIAVSITNSLLPDPICRKAQANLWFYSGLGYDIDSSTLLRISRAFDGVLCLFSEAKERIINAGVTIPIHSLNDLYIPIENAKDNAGIDINSIKGFVSLHLVQADPYLEGTDLVIKEFVNLFDKKSDAYLVIVCLSCYQQKVKNIISKISNPADVSSRIYIFIQENFFDCYALFLKTQVVISPARISYPRYYLDFIRSIGIKGIFTELGTIEKTSSYLEDMFRIKFVFIASSDDSYFPRPILMEPDISQLRFYWKSIYGQKIVPITDIFFKNKYNLASLNRRQSTSYKLTQFNKKIAENIGVSPRVGMLTTWNTRCGIAGYARELIASFPVPPVIFAPRVSHTELTDECFVHRCWSLGETDDLVELTNKIIEHRINVLIIQFNYNFFNFSALNTLVKTLINRYVVVLWVLHSTKDHANNPNKHLSIMHDALSYAHRILVHSSVDCNRLKDLGIFHNLMLFPHGVLTEINNYIGKVKPSTSFCLATYGFFLPNKGLFEIIEACKILQMKGFKFHLLMVNAKYDNPISDQCISQVTYRIAELGLESNITLITDYLSHRDSLGWLAMADLIIYPYQSTGESSSAAVRVGLASQKPVAVTPLSIFEDVSSVIHYLPGTTPEHLCDGIQYLMGLIEARSLVITEKSEDQKVWLALHSYSKISKLLYNIITGLIRNNF